MAYIGLHFLKNRSPSLKGLRFSLKTQTFMKEGMRLKKTQPFLFFPLVVLTSVYIDCL